MFGLFKYRKRLDRRCLSNPGSNYITLIQDQCSLKKFKSLMRDGQQIYYILFHSGLVIGPKNFRILNFSNIFVLRATIQFYSKHQRGKKTLRTFLFWFKKMFSKCLIPLLTLFILGKIKKRDFKDLAEKSFFFLSLAILRLFLGF